MKCFINIKYSEKLYSYSIKYLELRNNTSKKKIFWLNKNTKQSFYQWGNEKITSEPSYTKKCKVRRKLFFNK